MKIQFFTLCDFAQNNAGKLTIVGTFNRIFTDKFPCVYHSPFFVVAKVCSNTSYQGSFTFSASAPGDKPFLNALTKDFIINNKEEDGLERSFDFCMSLNNPLFPEPGKYTFRFEVEGQVATQDLYLSLKEK